MFDRLRTYLEVKLGLSLTKEQLAFAESLFIPKKLPKGGFLLREGEVPKYGTFICKGLLRSYVIDNKGKEHIVQFACEDWWLSDLDSMNNGTPTMYFMEALEDSEVLLMPPDSFKKLMETLPGFAASFQKGFQKHTATKEKRIVASLVSNAEERYNDFLQKYPNIVQRVPQHMLASYLGISPETLSRIRKQQSQRK